MQWALLFPLATLALNACARTAREPSASQPAPISALAGQRQDTSGCVYGGWSRPQSFISDSATRIDYASVTTGKSNTFVVGTIELAFRRTMGTAEPRPTLPSFLRAVTLSGRSLGAPHGNFVFVYPRSALDSQGNLHVVWGEPDSSAAVRSVETLGEVPVTSLWHATWRQGRWSRPRLVYRRKDIYWELVQGSKLIATPSQLALAFPLHQSDAPGGLVVLLTFTGGVWRATEIPNPTGAVYADVVALDRGGFAVAYVAAGLPPPGEHEGQENNVFVTTSDAAGVHWSKPVPVAGADQFPGLQPILLQGEGAELHLIWTQYARGMVTTGLWHARSGDRGTTWSSEPRLPLHVQVNPTAAVVDRCSTVHVGVELHSSSISGPRIGYTRVERGSWTPLTVLFPDRIGALPVMWSGVNGGIQMLFYDSPVIADSGRSARPRITTLELR